ncbi:mitochondrial import inner membrane translocase subunit Tim13-like [Drosophila sulfurigaster albostrigata]|uniref:mitochondrial import inner membrane translocase subunit Tim13-like n=1 Tax=Drosophila sulfurigaster albostrigata TaxID=89887 RepID=UPI002D218335|nr:mitochondrial import inner membrane translocase subunit Tim13-like [Drosophila sulfurigaster albostrigata]
MKNDEPEINQIRQEIALANAQQMLKKITVNCFKKCVEKPSVSLTKYEERCLIQCMDRFMDSIKVVTLSYSRRLQKESSR